MSGPDTARADTTVSAARLRERGSFLAYPPLELLLLALAVTLIQRDVAGVHGVTLIFLALPFAGGVASTLTDEASCDRYLVRPVEPAQILALLHEAAVARAATRPPASRRGP